MDIRKHVLGDRIMLDDKIYVHKEDLIKMLLMYSQSDQKEILKNFLVQQLAQRKEKYKDLNPVGFQYSPPSAKKYRDTLEEQQDTQQMQYLKDNISYNKQGTINILKLNKTFCKDISRFTTIKQERRNRPDEDFKYPAAKKLEKNNKAGYSMMTDYNKIEAPEIHQASDFYKLMNIFNPYGDDRGDTVEATNIFCALSGCTSRVWTKTTYLKRDGTRSPQEMCIRFLTTGLSHIYQSSVYIKGNGDPSYVAGDDGSPTYAVCGRKDMK